MMQLRSTFAFVPLAWVATIGCVPPTVSSSGAAGAHASAGGALSTGGAAGTRSGGTPGTGGVVSGGGTPGTGGTVGSGGAMGTGGQATAGGGTTGTGGSTTGSGGSGSGGLGSGGSNSGGASQPDAGSSSGGRGTAGTGGTGGTGPKASCPPGIILCDDFESYPAGTAPTGQWKTTTKGAGAAIVDTMKAYSGANAVHFSGSVNQDEAYMRASGAPVFPIGGNTLFVRFMMYVQYYPNANPMHVRFAWVGTTGVSSNMDGSGYAMATYNGVAIERIASGYLRDTTQAMTQAANQNKWLCWEFEISNTEGPAAGEGGTVLPRIWREGAALNLAMAGSKVNWNPASWDLLQFSLFAYQADPAIAHYWFDDIAVSNQKIGCPPAK